MRRKKRSILHLVFGLLSLVGLLYLIFSFPPDWKFALRGVEGLKFEIIIVFFLLLFSSLSLLTGVALNNIRRGRFIGIFVVSYLFLRLIGLTEPLYLLLLLAIFLILELVFSKQY